MAVLEVYEYPHPVLKKKAVKVEKVDDALRKLMDDMLETMYSAVGVVGGASYKLLVGLSKILPKRLVVWAIGKLYGYA